MTEPIYDTKRWLAFYVKPRHEKKVAERLHNFGVEVTDGGNVLGITGMEGVVVKSKGNQVSIRIESLQAQLLITVPRRMLMCQSHFKPLNQRPGTLDVSYTEPVIRQD